MGLKIFNASNLERQEAQQMGRHLVMGKYYHADKTVEKFISSFENASVLMDSNPRDVLNDPTVTGFKLFFHFSADSGLLADEGYENSALKYLSDIGDVKRYNLLKLFISRLSEVNTNQPWIFHTIEGLREVYTNPWASLSFFNENSKLTISTYETVDLKMASLNRLWREIIYDKNRGVMVLPENLRSFGLSIYLLDMRVFNTKFQFLRNWETTNLADITHQLFEFGNCQFLQESGGGFLDVVTNLSIQENMNNFTIGFDTADISILSPSMMGEERLSKSELSLLGAVLENKLPVFDSNILKQTAKETAQNTIDNAKKYGESQLSYYAYQEFKLSNASNYVTNLLSNIKGGIHDVNQLYEGNLQGAGLVNLANSL